MRVTRVHVELRLAAGIEIELPESATNHLARVLRLGIGDTCVLFNGDGHDYPAHLVEAGKRVVRVEVGHGIAINNESPLRLILLQGITRGEKMDLILQKATELGVASLHPLYSQRSEVRLDGARADKRLAHWRGVVVSACEQSGRARVPDVTMPLPLAQTLAAMPDGGLRLILDPDADASLSQLTLDPSQPVCLAVGPEGGWSPQDLDQLRAAGFSGMRLGPRVLRTETAGIAALAALQAFHGDLG
ncbi:16S rRNA (uracil(1498)-N(3))-methyltransferase [Thermomonas sp.]|uniref:16S rRNA (uracil(1498)-N(3))-methyltransferase n=1 Tax=Thermomonas sp. TaxID=1971895 RepID=UPI0024899727|nr:16S rRNA (uracil(1498)-N(3))-methyltransferase [Thermomonas sp.]MDI1254380.1 16S rRNA (uracil(1498)-N(3))-methyltransferase [Thermomonas sp.]